jgi:hypothetical protein
MKKHISIHSTRFQARLRGEKAFIPQKNTYFLQPEPAALLRIHFTAG